MKLELNKAELMAVWDALQQLIDNTDEGADAEPRELATRQAAEAVVARIEARLVPAMKAGGKLPDI